MTLDLNNKVCIVTGAAQGIGAEIAKRYVKGGAKVAIADLNLESANATAKELTAMGPGEAMGDAQIDARGAAHHEDGLAGEIETEAGHLPGLLSCPSLRMPRGCAPVGPGV